MHMSQITAALVGWTHPYPLCLSPAPAVASTWYGGTRAECPWSSWWAMLPHPPTPGLSHPGLCLAPGCLAGSLMVFTAIYGKAGSRGPAHPPAARPRGRKGGNLPAFYGVRQRPSSSGGDAVPLAGGVPGAAPLSFPPAAPSSSVAPAGLFPAPKWETVRTEAEKWSAKFKLGARGRNTEWGVWGWADCSKTSVLFK